MLTYVGYLLKMPIEFYNILLSYNNVHITTNTIILNKLLLSKGIFIYGGN